MNLHKDRVREGSRRYLQAHGWLYSPNDADYDRERALFPEDVLGWLAGTQPNNRQGRPGRWDTAKQESQLLDRIVKSSIPRWKTAAAPSTSYVSRSDTCRRSSR